MNGKRLLALLAALLFTLDVAVGAFLWMARPRTTDRAPSLKPAPITRLTHDSGNALHAVWSPDGRLIAFESNRDGPYHIYVMNADGSRPRALTHGTNDDRDPVWTLDGKAIYFDSCDGTHQDIWSVNVADGRLQQVT
jgi:Tol biopolymer transport system component